MAERVRALAIDGGGVRGIIPAMILAEIERRTGRATAELFDLIAGSSIGGILALALAKPDACGRPQYTAEETLTFFEEQASRIFSCGPAARLPVLGFVWSMFRPKYCTEDLRAVLAERFGETRMGEAVTDVLIGSYDVERGEPRFFSNRSDSGSETAAADLLMREVARATSAAPGFFPPAVLEGPTAASRGGFVDGALFAQNAGLLAFTEVRARYGSECELLLASLGCGRTPCRVSVGRAQKRGFLKWGPDIVRISLDGASQMIDLQLERLLPARDGQRRLYRLQRDIDPSRESIDDVSRDNIRALKQFAREMIEAESDAIDGLCQQLTTEA